MTFQPIPGTLVIGLGHKARHGKDSAARILMETFKGVQRFSFADDLYAVCRVLHGMTLKDAPLLQRVGVEYRERDEDVWVKAVYAKLLNERPRVAAITDVRFPNEMAFVRALGGVCWKVERRLLNGEVFIDPSRPASHISETALEHAAWDRVLVNPDGQPDVFRERVLCTFHALAHELDESHIESVGQLGFVIPAHAKVGAALTYLRLFARGFLQVALVAANTRQIAAGHYSGAFVVGGLISLVWWFNSSKNRPDGAWAGPCYALGAAAGTVFGMWVVAR